MITRLLYGYLRVNGAVEIDPDVADRIRRFFELANSGIPIREAAKTAGIDKSTSYLHKMLNNPAYAGKGDYPAIIFPDQVGRKVAHKRMVRTEHRPIQILTGFRYGTIPEADEDVNPADYVAMLYDCIEAELPQPVLSQPVLSQPVLSQPIVESQLALSAAERHLTQPAVECQVAQPAVECTPAAESKPISETQPAVEIAVPENPAASVEETAEREPEVEKKSTNTISLSFDPTPVKSENEHAPIVPSIPITTIQTTTRPSGR